MADLERPVLDEDDRHHLARALRLRPGDALTVSDGAGRWRAARFGPEVEVVGDVVVVPDVRPSITVGLAPVKGQRPEWAVQKLTELGVDAVWLLVADRSVVRWEGERGDGHADRLARVAREAAMQCRRCRLPVIRVGVPLAEAVAADGAALAEPGGAPPTLDRAPALVGLGATILRAETAAVVAGTLLTALRTGVVTESITDGG